MKKVVYGVILIAIFGLTACGNDKKETTASSKVEQLESRVKDSESSSSIESELDTSTETSRSSEKKVEIKNKIDLSYVKDMQFSGHANIRPIRAKIKNEKLTFDFDWRNDDGSVDERSFNGSSVTIIAYQNGTELEQLPDTYSGVDQYIEKNQTLEINLEYKLIDNSTVTIKLLPLEGDTQEFSFDLTN